MPRRLASRRTREVEDEVDITYPGFYNKFDDVKLYHWLVAFLLTGNKENYFTLLDKKFTPQTVLEATTMASIIFDFIGYHWFHLISDPTYDEIDDDNVFGYDAITREEEVVNAKMIEFIKSVVKKAGKDPKLISSNDLHKAVCDLIMIGKDCSILIKFFKDKLLTITDYPVTDIDDYNFDYEPFDTKAYVKTLGTDYQITLDKYGVTNLTNKSYQQLIKTKTKDERDSIATLKALEQQKEKARQEYFDSLKQKVVKRKEEAKSKAEMLKKLADPKRIMESEAYKKKQEEARMKALKQSFIDSSKKFDELLKAKEAKQAKEMAKDPNIQDEYDEAELDDLLQEGSTTFRDYLQDYFKGNISNYLQDVVTVQQYPTTMSATMAKTYADFLYVLFSYQWIDIQEWDENNNLVEFVDRIFPLGEGNPPKNYQNYFNVNKLIKSFLADIGEFANVKLTSDLRETIVRIAKSLEMSEWFLGFFYDKLITMNDYFAPFLTDEIEIFVADFEANNYTPNLEKYGMAIDASIIKKQKEELRATTNRIRQASKKLIRSRRRYSEVTRYARSEVSARKIFRRADIRRLPESAPASAKEKQSDEINIQILQSNTIDLFQTFIKVNSRGNETELMDEIIKLYERNESFSLCFNAFLKYLIKNTYYYCYKDLRISAYFKYPKITGLKINQKNDLIDEGLDILFTGLNEDLRISKYQVKGKKVRGTTVNNLIKVLSNDSDGYLWRQVFIDFAEKHITDIEPVKIF